MMDTENDYLPDYCQGTGLNIYTIKGAVHAAVALGNGHVIDWQPGDGTRYECEQVITVGDRPFLSKKNRYLVIRNFSTVVPLRGNITCADWVLNSSVPVGAWSGMRPLLAAMGFNDGEMTLDRADARKEADLRAHGRDPAPLNAQDAILGRKVRRLVEAEHFSEGTPPPGNLEGAEG